jgi:hypothetical protein
MQPYCRPLDDSVLAEHFVINILELESKFRQEAINRITQAETQSIGVAERFTLSHKSYRDIKYQTEDKRKELREKIFYELSNLQRLEDDDKIKLGIGGSLPHGGTIIKEKNAYILTGLPASGKSQVAHKISDEFGAVILDPDFAKRKFPEYKQANIGASLVHEESSLVIFGGRSKESNILEWCCANKNNIVIPTIGHESKNILDLAQSLKNSGYKVHITLVSLDRKKATMRAYKRFTSSKRYVPLSLIFDWYSNEPILTYYRIKENSVFTSYGKISSDVSFGDPFIYIDSNSNTNPAKLYQKP